MRSFAQRRKAFSLVELMVVSVLMVVLAVLLSSAWAGVGRTATDLIGRSHLVQERDLAIAALSRDLGGHLSAAVARTGERRDGRWLRWELPSAHSLKLFFDGGTNAGGVPLADTSVQYLLTPDTNPAAGTQVLVRRISISGGTAADFVVARNVYSMNVTTAPDDATAIRIVLCFKYRALTLTSDLTIKPPAVPPEQNPTWTLDHYTQS